MSLVSRMITIDCRDPQTLAQFWSAAVGYKITLDYPEFVMLESGDGSDPLAIGLQKVPDPTPGKNRVHLDYEADDPQTEVARLTSLGAARIADREVPGLRWTVMADPDGNQFCIGKRGDH
jgi:predicted enzyme related to lactoylglutathione lyase